ncbi:MAG: protein of unknown function acetylesterase [Sphingobacteriales bacterium]|nr:protein of unknown function acetylesterase [Sphingobacteriales bacterium]
MKAFLICLISFSLSFQIGFCDIKLPRLISNGMILQRNAKINVWGWGSIGEKVSVKFNNKEYKTVTDAGGKWKVTLPQMNAGGPYIMQIDANNHITLTDILLGDVWVCSGQSNMELPMSRVKVKYEKEIANATYPKIRQFNVATTYNFKEKQSDFTSGDWVAADPRTVLNFSAVAYFFAKELYLQYQVPIGIIKASVGGSPAQAWLSEESLKKYPEYLALTNRYKDSLAVDSIKKADAAAVNNWNKNIDDQDLGWNSEFKWFNPNQDASQWKTMKMPGFWDEDAGFRSINEASNSSKNTNGVMWFRKEVIVPQSMIGKPAKLILGAIIDRDLVYLNGEFVGTTSYQYPPRRYEILVGLLKAGKNTIVVRVISNTGLGGFVKDKEYSIRTDKETVNLAGDWQYKMGYVSVPMPGGGTTFQYQPAGLFNAMISPLGNNTAIKGVIWYQGESNTSNPKEYQSIFSDVIKDWRLHWNQGTFPFLYVQLANFMQAKSEPTESEWAELRYAQLKTLSVPKTGMAVTIDVGEWNDIHPLTKETVGKRLALAAQKLAYGNSNIVHSGPIYQSKKIVGKKIILSFTNIGSGLVAKGDQELKYFAIAGADKKFVWAKAKINGNKVEVWSESIPHPVSVRYAWADNPDKANLYNKENLPASPFTTD